MQCSWHTPDGLDGAKLETRKDHPMTTIRDLTAPFFSAAAALALTLGIVGGTVTAPAQSPLHTTPATEYAA